MNGLQRDVLFTYLFITSRFYGSHFSPFSYIMIKHILKTIKYFDKRLYKAGALYCMEFSAKRVDILHQVRRLKCVFFFHQGQGDFTEILEFKIFIHLSI